MTIKTKNASLSAKKQGNQFSLGLKVIASRFLKNRNKSSYTEIAELLYGNSSPIEFKSKDATIPLDNIENRQGFARALPMNLHNHLYLNTLNAKEFANLNIKKIYYNYLDLEREINIEPFKDLRKKIKTGRANKDERELLDICNKHHILFGEKKDIYEVDENGEDVYEGGERKIKVKGGAFCLCIGKPTMKVSMYEFDELNLLSPDIIKKYWGVTTLSFLHGEDSEDLRKITLKLLNYMEAHNISDLHIKMYDDEFYTFSARQHTKNIRLKDEDGEVSMYSALKTINIINQLKQMGNKDTDTKEFATNALLSVDLTNGRRNFRLNRLNAVYSNTRGHSISLRRLSKEEEVKELKDLNYMDLAINLIFALLLNEDDGLIVISGETNSGKSTFLNALIIFLRDYRNDRIMRIENPVETDLKEIITIDYSHYENGDITKDDIIKEFLRHDPDVTILGEGRDDEELKAALWMAIKGHRTFLTMHSGTIEDAYKRFINIDGINNVDFNTRIKMSLNQKLILKPCRTCTELSDKDAANCPTCGGSRASGVLPIFDLVVYTNVRPEDNILDTDKLVNENKAFRITKQDCIQHYRKRNLIDKEVLIVGTDNEQVEDLNGYFNRIIEENKKQNGRKEVVA